ncbi:hypothetical protein [Pseudofrankia sp. BMG5.37]|nr:hypothetical protein [Pseudofrankia sp. BMG5.37]MDT3441904.1 hypothetical protein [Pseudofrankia sp. BMG5.37]
MADEIPWGVRDAEHVAVYRVPSPGSGLTVFAVDVAVLGAR